MSPTRRSLLSSTLLVAVGGAGCSGLTGGPNARRTDDHEPSRTDPDPVFGTARNPDGDPVVASVGDNGRSRATSTYQGLVASRDQARAVEFADGVSQEDVESVRELFAGTDFSESTVFYTHARVGSCRRLRIRNVSWGPGEIEYTYCSELRGPDERCRDHTSVLLGIFFRIPEVLTEEVTSLRTSTQLPCPGAEGDWETVTTTEDDR